ncbi:MAG: enoyl-CoA hydratase-related protein [Pseudomonadota bacterium]
MSEAPLVLTEDIGGVRKITLNRPDRLNALNEPIMAALADAVLDASAANSIGCVVLTGAGRGFCAGGDVNRKRSDLIVNRELGGRVEQSHARLRGEFESARLLHEMPKPTIAMINGPVAGAGIGLAGACDLRFASRSATFLSAFDRIGASGDFGATWFWTKILGTAKARELFFLGEKFDAERALEFGLYTKIFDDEVLETESLKIAERLTNGPRIGWRYMKRNLNFAEDGQFEAHLDQESLFMSLSVQASASMNKAEKKAAEDEE